jgi:hypothetical protein
VQTKGIALIQGKIIAKSKNTLKIKKIFFSRTSRPISIKLDTHYPWVKGIEVCSNKGPGPLQMGDNCKKGGSFKNLLQNHPANLNQTWHKSSLGQRDSSLFKRRGYPISKGR